MSYFYNVERQLSMLEAGLSVLQRLLTREAQNE